MSSLTDLPEIVGFFSYSRDDDEDFGLQLSSLRDAIQKELAAALGRNKRNFRLWQDKDAIAPGEMWEQSIASAINEATFFIPIVTPRAVSSEHCKFEFNAFLAREKALGRNNLVFPIHYITVPALGEESKWRSDPVLSVVGARQFVDWRRHRQWPTDTPAYREAIADFCEKIVEVLREPRVSPEERRRQEEDAQLGREADLRNRGREAGSKRDEVQHGGQKSEDGKTTETERKEERKRQGDDVRVPREGISGIASKSSRIAQSDGKKTVLAAKQIPRPMRQITQEKTTTDKVLDAIGWIIFVGTGILGFYLIILRWRYASFIENVTYGAAVVGYIRLFSFLWRRSIK